MGDAIRREDQNVPRLEFDHQVGLMENQFPTSAISKDENDAQALIVEIAMAVRAHLQVAHESSERISCRPVVVREEVAIHFQLLADVGEVGVQTGVDEGADVL